MNENEPIQCLLFDGKIDDTLVIKTDENGRRCQATISEDHYTLVAEPGNRFLGHVAPEKKDAKSVANAIWTFLEENILKDDLELIGGDSTVHNTGHKGGVFFYIQEWIGHRLLISVCKLHTNELPLRHVIKGLGIPTISNNKFGGAIGKLICGDVEKLPFNPNFKRIRDDRVSIPILSPEVVDDLSTDQRYAYRMLQLLMGGEVDEKFLALKCGPPCHSRWLTTADRFSRVYVSDHGLTGEDDETLTLVVTHTALHYFPVYFHIKCSPTLVEAPRHVLLEMQICRDVLPSKIKDIVRGKIEDGAWMAHSEILLLHLLASEDEEKRRFAVQKIIAMRGESQLGDTRNRPHKVPKLNWDAQKVEDIIVWDDATEPILTARLDSNAIRAFLSQPFVMKPFPSHTQSVERLVKEVSAASAKVCGVERVDGYVLARCGARKLVPKADKKSDFHDMLQ